MALRQYLSDWLKASEPEATLSPNGSPEPEPPKATNGEASHRRQASAASAIVNIEAVSSIIFSSGQRHYVAALDDIVTDVESEVSPQRAVAPESGPHFNPPTIRGSKSPEPPAGPVRASPDEEMTAVVPRYTYELKKAVIQTDELDDFLAVVARPTTFTDGHHLIPQPSDPEAHSGNVATLTSPSVDNASTILEVGETTNENEVLQEFREYWQDQIDCLGPQAKIDIKLVNARAEVKALKPLHDGRLPNMWEPIVRQYNIVRHLTYNVLRSCRFKTKQNYHWQSIFENVNAHFQPGKMTLLLGAPGTGKSTLLKLIAGRLEKDDHWKTNGVVINDVPLHMSEIHLARVVALVDEADVHLPTMTVEDTLRFAYKCNSKMGKDQHVQTIMKILGLTHVAKSIIGDENIRGISGGEKRRVTVGEQWAANVRVFLADRLTDGLDSQAALDLIKALRVWCCTTDATVVLSLLQPPPEAYRYFDEVCILQDSPGNNVRYCGPIREAAAILGQVGYEATDTNQRPKPLEEMVPSRGRRSQAGLLKWRPEKQRDSGYRRSYIRHLKLCIRRQATLEFGNRGLIISRILLNVINGFATASIYNTDGNDNYVLDVKSALIFHMCMSSVLSVISHISLFAQDRPVFYRQRAASFFRASNYWIAHNFFQLVCWGLLESLLLSAPAYWLTGLQKSFPKYLIFWMALYLLNLCSSVIFKVLAIICSTTEISQTLAGMVQIVFFLFSGYLQRWQTTPAGWIWARFISPQSYAFIILMVNEFEDTTYTCSPSELLRYEGVCPYTNGTTYLLQEFDTNVNSAVIGPFFCGLIGWYVAYAVVGAICLHFVQWRPTKMHRLKLYSPKSVTPHLLMPAPAVLSWHNVTYTVTLKSCCGPQIPKILLHQVEGVVKPATLTALMGPSGAGKTTMMDVLAGRKTQGVIDGDINVNGRPKNQNSFTRMTGYVEQMNCMTEALTVMEALKFSARFRLPQSIGVTEQLAFIEAVVEMLELTAVVYERVMDILVDQKKRCAVGVEVVSRPSILFLDEPTTGLDSLGAHLLLRALHRVRDEMRVAIVCTIHQPSKDLFFKFDRLVLLAKGGHMVYTGNLGPKATTFINYLESVDGVRILKLGENPASWMLEQIGGGIQPDLSVVESVLKAWGTSEPQALVQQELAAIQPAEAAEGAERFVISQSRQLQILVNRCFRIYWRSDSYNLVRSLLVVVMALLFGTVYWRMDYSQKTVWTRLSFCYTSSFYVGLTFLLSGVTILMPQRAAFYREQACNAYSSWCYGVAFFIAELPYVTLNSLLFLCITWFFAALYWQDQGALLGQFWQLALPFWAFLYMCTILGHCICAISPSMEVANAIGPGVASWFSSFAGFYLPRPYLPTGYLFIYWLNPFRYAFEALILTEFADAPISCGDSLLINATGQPLCIYKSGNDVIQHMGMLEWGYGLDVGVLFGYMLAFGLITLLGLRFLRFGTK
eukprot:EG_transcript_329